VTCSGRLFQTRAAATGKARSPTVDSRVRLTISDEDELERSRSQASTFPILTSCPSDNVWNLNCADCCSTVFTTWRRTISLHHVSAGRREPQPSVPAFSCAWRPCRSSDMHNPLRSSNLRRRWTVHMELAPGTATKLSTIILVPA